MVGPAVGQVVDGHRSGRGAGVGVEVLHERQGGDHVTFGGNRMDIGHIAETAAPTVGLDIEVVAHGGTQTADCVRIGVSRFRDGGRGSGREAGGTVGDHPFGGGSDLRPGQRDAVGRDGSGGHIGGLRTFGYGLHTNVIDIAVVVAGGRLRGSQGDVLARSRVLA